MAKSAAALPPAQRALARLTGARLCYGRPVEMKGRTVIPVASVRTAGGWGFGNQTDPDASRSGSGGGGGGALDARPIGFIEVTPEGTRFERIDDGRTALRALAAGSLLVLVASRALSRRRGASPRLHAPRLHAPHLSAPRLHVPSLPALPRPTLVRPPSLRRLRRGAKGAAEALVQVSQDS
ncbi:MAG TPA: spore germination protein GerW family protein [Solirubrobacteraceae bacterium]